MGEKISPDIKIGGYSCLKSEKNLLQKSMFAMGHIFCYTNKLVVHLYFIILLCMVYEYQLDSARCPEKNCVLDKHAGHVANVAAWSKALGYLSWSAGLGFESR